MNSDHHFTFWPRNAANPASMRLTPSRIRERGQVRHRIIKATPPANNKKRPHARNATQRIRRPYGRPKYGPITSLPREWFVADVLGADAGFVQRAFDGAGHAGRACNEVDGIRSDGRLQLFCGETTYFEG